MHQNTPFKDFVLCTCTRLFLSVWYQLCNIQEKTFLHSLFFYFLFQTGRIARNPDYFGSDVAQAPWPQSQNYLIQLNCPSNTLLARWLTLFIFLKKELSDTFIFTLLSKWIEKAYVEKKLLSLYKILVISQCHSDEWLQNLSVVFFYGLLSVVDIISLICAKIAIMNKWCVFF